MKKGNKKRSPSPYEKISFFSSEQESRQHVKRVKKSRSKRHKSKHSQLIKKHKEAIGINDTGVMNRLDYMIETEEQSNLVDTEPTVVHIVEEQEAVETQTYSDATISPRYKEETDIATQSPERPPFLPAVATQTHDRFRDTALDVLLENRIPRQHAAFMHEYLRRTGMEETQKVFICPGGDHFIKRALISRGWVENKNKNSSAFHLKWVWTDVEADYKPLSKKQLFNHIPGNRDLTTKSGLVRKMRAVGEYGINVDAWYPRSYDLGEFHQMDEFEHDFEQIAIFNLIKKHAEVFLSEQDTLVNENCLFHALEYCKWLLNQDPCENNARYEFIVRNTRPFKIQEELWGYILHYSTMSFPIHYNIPFEEKEKSWKKQDVEFCWKLPRLHLIEETLRMHEELRQMFLQYTMNGTGNVWMIKPGQNSKGSGVACYTDKNKILKIASKLKSRIIQKYVETPLLLSIRRKFIKFDIRQWVLVTSVEPLHIYFFDTWYLRLCAKPYTENDLWDLRRHVSNYAIQKSSQDPDRTTWSLESFMDYLEANHPGISWTDDIVHKIHYMVIKTLESIDTLEHKKGCFELYGFDIILDSTFTPWLLEVNLSPACSERTPWLNEMVEAMGTGIIEVLEQDLTPPALYSTDYQLEGPLQSNTLSWLCLYIGPTAGKSKTQVYNAADLEIVGTRANYRKERNMDRVYFMQKASAMLIKYAKGFLVRNRAWHKVRGEAALLIQTKVRVLLAKNKVIWRKDVIEIEKILKWWKIKKARRYILYKQKMRLARLVQKRYRGNRGRQDATQWREVYTAGIVYRMYKTYLGRSAMTQEIDYNCKIRLIQHTWKIQFRLQGKSSQLIQRIWRGHQGRLRFKACRIADNNLRCIQKVMRGYLGRAEGTRLLHFISARKLQCRYRMFKAKTRLHHHKSARAIQTRFRCFKESKKLKQYLAARNIQCAYRQLVSKKKLTYLLRRRAFRRFSQIYRASLYVWFLKIFKVLSLKHDRGIRTVQRFAKGRQERKDYALRLKCSYLDVILNKFKTYKAVTAVRAKKLYEKRLYAAIICQKYIRGYIHRRKYSAKLNFRALSMEKVKRITKLESSIKRKLDRQISPVKCRRYTAVTKETEEDIIGNFFASQKHSGMENSSPSRLKLPAIPNRSASVNRARASPALEFLSTGKKRHRIIRDISPGPTPLAARLKSASHTVDFRI